MLKKFNSISVSVDPWLLVLAAMAVLMIPIRWLMGWIAATMVHEISHYYIMRLFSVRVYRLSIGLPGILMETEPMAPSVEMLSALAGPLGGLALLFLAKRFPILALCAFVQSAFNLLPIYPLDGGRVIHLLLQRLPYPLGKNICAAIGNVVLLLVLCACLYGSVRLQLGGVPIIFAIVLLLRCGKQKFLAKM